MSSIQNNRWEDMLTDRTSSHNVRLLRRLKEGDLVEIPRSLYSHWGVYVGFGYIVHLSGEDDDGINASAQPSSMFSVSGEVDNRACVRKEKLLKVAGDSRAKKNNSKDRHYRPLPAPEVVSRALSKVGDEDYNVFTNNCEHFVNWCRYDEAESDQVDNFKSGAAKVGAVGLNFLGDVLEEKTKRDRRNGKESQFETFMAVAAKATAAGLNIYHDCLEAEKDRKKGKEEELTIEENPLVSLLAAFGAGQSENKEIGYRY